MNVPTENAGTFMNESATLVMTTVGSEELARTLAARLLDERLAACVQEIRINSHYRWNGDLHYEPEILLLVKTSAKAAPAAMRLIEDIHSYDVPEIIALPVTAGLPAYLEWVAGEADGKR
ncbi:MAG TPA: divalent-cation tolerance protein CutA [Woeseiaceae bacterium]|nr:divalent-cation tolerance protein CutA [Woeseiaceae bacterium]